MDIYQRQGSKNRILSKEQISQVNEYAVRLMEDIGCRVSCEEALEILGRAGCDVSNPERVKIPRKLVVEAVEAASGAQVQKGLSRLNLAQAQGVAHSRE